MDDTHDSLYNMSSKEIAFDCCQCIRFRMYTSLIRPNYVPTWQIFLNKFLSFSSFFCYYEPNNTFLQLETTIPEKVSI